MLLIIRTGLLLGLSTIMSFGPQNLFLLRQGIMRQHVFLAASICFFCDIILMSVSVMGAHGLITALPGVKTFLLLAGLIFLGSYGLLSLKNAYKTYQLNTPLAPIAESGFTSKALIFFSALSFSLLNPQAIIDSFLVIGGFSTQFSGLEQWAFLLGIVLASGVWFYGIVIIVMTFANKLRRPRVWATLEFVSGIIMLAYALLFLKKIV